MQNIINRFKKLILANVIENSEQLTMKRPLNQDGTFTCEKCKNTKPIEELRNYIDLNQTEDVRWQASVNPGYYKAFYAAGEKVLKLL